MDNLRHIPVIAPWSPPLILDMRSEGDRATLQDLLRQGQVTRHADTIDRALLELFHIACPHLVDRHDVPAYEAFVAERTGGDKDGYGRWVWYPWSGHLVHVPPRDDFEALKSSRNRNLVTEPEQQTLRGASIAVIGLSVGSNVVESLVLQGIGRTVVLFDTDSIDPTNLNRIHGGYATIGLHKIDALAQKVSEANPYVEQVHYREGLTEATLVELFSRHRPQVVVDEMDSLRLKVRVRQEAAKARVPVIMAADDGDSALVDIERYDAGDQALFHGQIPPEVIARILGDERLSRLETGALIGRYFVGEDNIPLRMYQSLFEVGTSLPSWPQLGGTATLAGVCMAYCAKKILLGQPLASGRHLIGPDEHLNPEIDDPAYRRSLAEAKQVFGRATSGVL